MQQVVHFGGSREITPVTILQIIDISHSLLPGGENIPLWEVPVQIPRSQ